jgi:GNAT superfamily N-acetyltransferase
VDVGSLALTTELGLAATRGAITDRGDHLVVERPDAPSWAYGNFLALPRAPAPADVPRWIERFAAELGTERTVALRWDDPTGEDAAIEALRAHGFRIDVNEVLAATDVLAPLHALPMRALESGEVLSTVILAWQLSERHDETMRQLLHARAAWYADLVDRRLASFWGAYDSGKLIASVGLVRLGALGRYQDVQTLPAFRRRGLAGALLAAAAREARAYGVKRFVIFCEPGSDAARVYRRIGFEPVERTVLARRASG